MKKTNKTNAVVPDVSQVLSEQPVKSRSERRAENPEKRKDATTEAAKRIRKPTAEEGGEAKRMKRPTEEGGEAKRMKRPVEDGGETAKRSRKTAEDGSETKRTRKPVAETVEVVQVPDSSSLKSRRTAVSREELEIQFDQFIANLDSELELSRADKNHKVNMKVWRTLVKDVKRLKASSLKSMKKPKRHNPNAQSGFKKPLAIRSDMAEFANWDPSELKSRTDVTNYICEYVKANGLQNPEDKRQIIPDDRLKALLSYDPETETKPLTYFYLQNKIQPLFPKV